MTSCPTPSPGRYLKKCEDHNWSVSQASLSRLSPGGVMHQYGNNLHVTDIVPAVQYHIIKMELRGFNLDHGRPNIVCDLISWNVNKYCKWVDLRPKSVFKGGLTLVLAKTNINRKPRKDYLDNYAHFNPRLPGLFFLT